MRKTTQERFEEKVLRNPKNGCDEWQGLLDNFGYGIFHIRIGKRKSERAHRWAWMQTYGLIEEGMCVLHHCDNPKCLRLDHLFIGTRSDNNADRHSKGRDSRGYEHGLAVRASNRNTASGERNGTHTKPESVLRGESHGSSKLSDQIIRYIRERYKQGDVSYSDLAEEIGVTRANIAAIVKRRTWAHVQ